MLRPGFLNGFSAGLVLALVLGIYLFFLWQPRRQIYLHNEHFLHAIEQKSWSKVRDFMDKGYQNQWGQGRELVLSRLREVLRALRNFRINRQEQSIDVAQRAGEWRGRITVDSDIDEVSTMFKERVNALEKPFELRWQQQSGKPWDWKLVRVMNAGFEATADGFGPCLACASGLP